MRIRRRVKRHTGHVPAVAAAEVVHAAPVGGYSFTPCCDRTMMELPPYDRIGRYPEEVTCGRLSELDELLLAGEPLPGRRQNTEQLIYEMALSVRSIRGSRISLHRSLECVQAAVRELAPGRHSDEHWTANLLVEITVRAVDLAG